MKKPNPDQAQDYFFTFGTGHGYNNCYIKLRGTFQSTRDQMQSLFGSKWLYQFSAASQAGVKRHSMTKIKLNDIPHLRGIKE